MRETSAAGVHSDTPPHRSGGHEVSDLGYTIMFVGVFVGLLLVLRAVGHRADVRQTHWTGNGAPPTGIAHRDADDVD
jgi:hypothetical protein